MAVVPVPFTWVAGDAPTAAELNGTDGPKGVGDFVLSPPRVSAYQSAGVSVGTGTSTEILMTFDTTRWEYPTADSDAHSTSADTSRLYARTPGLWAVNYQVAFPANATGVRYVVLRKNAAGTSGGGTTVHFARQQAASATGASYVGASIDVPMAEDDYLELFALQNSGGSLTTVTGVTGTYVQMRWVASA